MINRNRIISIILTVCTILSMFCSVASVNAVSDDNPKTITDVYTPPDIVSADELAENGYIGRDKSAENNLNTFVFENSDGTKTMRVYSHPVKYIADDGQIKDISLEIKENANGAFSTVSHEIITTFEKKLTDGIKLEYDDIELKMVPIAPQTLTPTARSSADKRSVTYALDGKTSYVYELTYAGFKEDIVVNEYTGQTEYSFILYTNGLTLCEEFGSYYLADASGSIKATIGEIIVFTADERNNTMGSMSHETIKNDQAYMLTIHLDSDYLRDVETKYPIRIDPTVEINYDNEGVGAIEDVCINETATFSATSGSLSVGRHSAGSLSRTLMRFPNLEMPVTFAPMILSAQVELRDLMCQSDEDITVHVYQYKESSSSWSESGTTTWSSVGSDYYDSSSSGSLDSKLITYGNGNVTANRYAFDITSLAKLWADGVASPGKGIVFAAAPSFEAQTGNDVQKWVKTFASYNRSANKPSLSISYETRAVVEIQNSADETKYVTANKVGSAGIALPTTPTTTDGARMWCIEYLPEYNSNLYNYNIISMGIRYDVGVYPCAIYSTSAAVGLARWDRTAINQRFRPIRHTDGTYSFQNLGYGFYLSTAIPAITLSISSSNGSSERFELTEIAINTFNNFWSGTYASGIYSGVAHIQVKLDSSLTATSQALELFGDIDFSSALLWNGITENVIIYGPNDIIPDGITPFIVTFKSHNFMKELYSAVTVPNGIPYSTYKTYTDEQKEALNDQGWESVTIYMNCSYLIHYNPLLELPKDDDERVKLVNKTIAHEMGHALKLAHPMQLDGIHEHGKGGYQNNDSVYSLMNAGLPWFHENYITPLTAAVPQDHDMINLISKWEYHQTCSSE